ncbi:MAG: histidine phosphatase family protein [Gammaproteobacteria bacterium]|nr:MAG: histidine phosphatase family protein [Gammaproteobacteria bacterium]
MELILIRHGLPQHVETEDGSPADPPLSEIGHAQAGQMATWLQHEAIDTLYSSPMARAHQTAEPLARAQGLDIQIRDGVAEFDQHADSYVPVEKLKQIDYERWKRLMQGDLDVDMGAFADAVIQTLEELVTRNRGRRVAVTCHGGVINVWTAHVIGFTPRMFFNPDYTSINRFQCASSGERSVITLNEAIHLREVQG